MTEKEILVNCIQHYEMCINFYNGDFEYLVEHGVDDGVCYYIETELNELTPSWCPQSYWCSTPDENETFKNNVICLKVRLYKMKRILSTTFDEVYVPIFNPNQLKLW